MQMIKRRNLNTGVNANISLDPSAASQATSNINNNIIINKAKDEGEEVIIQREVEMDDTIVKDTADVRMVILETYAQILLNQDKALLSNLILKHCIIVPVTALSNIIRVILGNNVNVEIYLDEDIKCCAAKVNPIRKIDAIKIVTEDGEVVTDMKAVYNKEWNELIQKYHLCMKYAVYG